MTTKHEWFEWDEEKAGANFAKHGVSFHAAQTALASDPVAVEVADDRQEYGEARTISIVRLERVVLTVCWTMRGEVTRIISARRASRKERKRHAEQ